MADEKLAYLVGNWIGVRERNHVHVKKTVSGIFVFFCFFFRDSSFNPNPYAESSRAPGFLVLHQGSQGNFPLKV